MNKYDPDKPPDPKEWLSLDEGERIMLIEEYHVDANIDLPNATMHSSIHAVVENQIAMGEETAARDTIDRLMTEGLSRHDAIHAIGMVLAEHLYDMMKNPSGSDMNDTYNTALRSLTAESWLKSGQPETGGDA